MQLQQVAPSTDLGTGDPKNLVHPHGSEVVHHFARRLNFCEDRRQ